MTEVYYLIALIILVDGIILFCKFLFDRPNIFDREPKPNLVIRTNLGDYLLFPLLFVFPFSWLVVLTQDKANLYFLPFTITTVLAAISLALLIRYGFKRYYLTEKGIIVFNVMTNKYTITPIDEIKGYTFRRGFRSPPTYIVVTNNKKIGFTASQIKDLPQFKNYFKTHNISYYEYDWLAGNAFKK
jgi:hypothetical protein